MEIMDKKDLKLTRGQLQKGKPAEILFFDDVEYWSCDRFVEEFQYIENWVEPSEIRILINSSGGSVVEGMKVFSKILNSKIPTITQVAGIAASMGSVIWAAGQKLYMADYSLLMIHNPWMGADMSDPNNQQIIEAFKKQITTVYCKRFGFSEEKVKAIMDGKEGCDGTFLTASEAVEQGFIPESHVIETSQSIKDKIAASIKGIKEVGNIQAIMTLASLQNYQEEVSSAISRKEPEGKDNNYSQINKGKMDELKVIASQLGIQGEASLEAVSKSIIQLSKSAADLKTVSDELTSVKSELNDLKIKYEAEKANGKSLQDSLNEANSKLKGYLDKEKADRTAAINSMVDDAIAAGKITPDSKDSWVAMAEQNFDMVKSSLDGIHERVQLSHAIADDPNNKKKAAEGSVTEEEKVKAYVDGVVGEDFKFKTISDLN